MLLADDVLVITVMFRTKGSFSVDLDNTSTEICHEENESLRIVSGFLKQYSPLWY